VRIAIIPPVSLLETYGPAGDAYHLCLSNEVLKYPDYVNFYRSRSEQGDYVILDNSAHEQLQGQSVTQLLLAARGINPSEIVLPDRLFFGDDTLERSAEAYGILRSEIPTANLMGVPQGRTVDEWTSCLYGLKFLGVNTIGISKDYEVWDGGLLGLVHTVLRCGFNPESIHLLGWGRDLWKLTELAHLVRGVDSAKPIVYAMGGIQLPEVITSKNAPTYPKRRSNYFEDGGPYTEEFHKLVRDNIWSFRRAANSAYTRNTLSV
jgi:hypothetical protein